MMTQIKIRKCSRPIGREVETVDDQMYLGMKLPRNQGLGMKIKVDTDKAIVRRHRSPNQGKEV